MEELKVKKPTQKEMLTELARLAEENNKIELAEFCYDRIAQLEKKASASKAKSAESQVENDKIKNVILEVMARLGRAVTVTELTKEEELNSYSNQKLTYVLTKMYKEDGTVTNFKDKKKSMFKLAE